MKKTIFLLACATLFLFSCSKEKSVVKSDDMAQIQFQVMEETNVSHYVIQTSADGRTWKDSFVIMTADGAAMPKTYTADYSISEYRYKVYTQIKVVDKDNRVGYSVVKTNNF